ncbi:MAG: transcription termination/antitermination factor NusG [Kosmotoga sp.]|nr:transcription termination/antitermination protein NusG [Kosmotoga sp.]MBO8167155.1 transcription termination/antitermination factor NusG [Kosmotoga sp.]
MRKKWYIIQTYSGLENSIKEALEAKINSFGVQHLFGKILVPEEVKLDRGSSPAERHIVFNNAKILVNPNQDVKKGDPIIEDPEIHAKSDGIIKEIKNYRIIFIETIDRKFTKTYYVPESAKVETGIRPGARIRQGMPLTKHGENFCELDGRIVFTEKMKRIVVERDNGDEDVYMVYPKTYDPKVIRKGTRLKRGDLISEKRTIFSKIDGRVEVSEFTGRKELKIYKITKTRLYPGYIFIEMIMNDETWNIVKSTPNVVNFVSVGGQPIELKRKEIHALLKLVGLEEYEEKAPKIRIEVNFELNEMVRINSGPFEDFVGKITEIHPERQEVKVVVSIFGRETPVVLKLSEIEKIV